MIVALEAFGTLLEAIVVCALVFSGGGLWIIAMLKLWWGVKW